jgi:hypothetical protein
LTIGWVEHVQSTLICIEEKVKHQKPRANLSKAIEIIKECGADGWVAKYEKELAEL